MKKWLVILLALFGVFGMCACADTPKPMSDDDTSVSWQEIVSALDETGSFSRNGVTAVLENGKAVISGGTIKNIEISNVTPVKIRSIEINNASCDGRFMGLNISYGRTIELTLGGQLKYLDNRHEIGIIASGKTNVVFNNYSDAREIYCVAEEYSVITSNNYGDISRNYQGEANNKGKVVINNDGGIGFFATYADESGTVIATNSSTVSGLIDIDSMNGGKIHVINTGKADGLYVRAVENGKASFTNNGIIKNERGLDNSKQVYIVFDKTAEITIDGTGTIMPGQTQWDYLNDRTHEMKPAESIRLIALFYEFEDLEEARATAIQTIKYHIKLNLSGVNSHEGMDKAIAVVDYGRNRFLIRQEEFDEELGTIIRSDQSVLDDLGAAKRPTFVSPQTHLNDTLRFLKYRETVSTNKVTYSIRLVDQNGNEIQSPEGGTICFPYPKGITIKNANQYEFFITHYTSGNTELFSTTEGTIERKEAGLCIRVSSFSPFEITWEERPEIVLTQTGDDSHIGLWLALLTLSGIVVLTLKRKTV